MKRGEKMAKNEAPTFDEWVKERQAVANENRARAQAYYDATQKPEEKAYWTWMRDAFFELTNAFHALEWVNNYRSEADYKIFQVLNEQKKVYSQMVKTLLGLDNTATDKDVEERSKEFGKLVDSMMGEKKSLDKVTQQNK
jgi:hypothetical protein